MEKYYRVSDVNEILNRLAREPYYQHDEEDFYSGVCAVEGELMFLDSIEFEEPTAGKWIQASTKPGVQAGMKCSECKARITYSEYYNGQHLYCYNCGAKMSKES